MYSKYIGINACTSIHTYALTSTQTYRHTYRDIFLRMIYSYARELLNNAPNNITKKLQH